MKAREHSSQWEVRCIKPSPSALELKDKFIYTPINSLSSWHGHHISEYSFLCRFYHHVFCNSCLTYPYFKLLLSMKRLFMVSVLSPCVLLSSLNVSDTKTSRHNLDPIIMRLFLLIRLIMKAKYLLCSFLSLTLSQFLWYNKAFKNCWKFCLNIKFI